MKAKILILGLLFCSQLFAQNLPSNVPSNGLDGWWPFNGNPMDSSGNGNDGTVINGASLTTDRFNSTNHAYFFNGTNYISLDTAFFNGSTSVDAFTYSIWFNIAQFPSNTAFTLSCKEGYWRTKRLLLDATNLGFYGTDPNPNGYFNCKDSIVNLIDTNEWHHVVVTYDDSTLNLYLDNNLLQTNKINYAVLDYSWVVAGNSTATNLFGASNPAAGLKDFFIGKLDDIGVWNRALSAKEVENLYCGSSSTLNASACDSYTSPSGKHIWTQTGTYHDTIANSMGCDSIITVNLNVTSIDTSITLWNDSLFSNELNATAYEWRTCPVDFGVVGTQKGLSPPYDGGFFVIVYKNGCKDSSACFQYSKVGIKERGPEDVRIYPNPSNGSLTISMGSEHLPFKLEVLSLQGQVLYEDRAEDQQEITINLKDYKGVLFLHLTTEEGTLTRKIIIQ